MAYIQPECTREQMSFLPMSLDEFIDESNNVRVIDAFVGALNLHKLGFRFANQDECKTKPAYDPQDMLKLYIYSYFNGIRSSRKIERECSRNIEVMWLINSLAPENKTICNFRKENKESLIKVFKQFGVFCQELNLVGKEIVAIDGTKIRANNSRKKNYTKGKVSKMIEYYEESAKKYLELLDSTEKTDDTQDKLDSAKNKISELKELLQKIQETGEISITDPDSKHMSVSNNGTDIAYNIQTAVDSKNHLIVATEVITEPCDNGQLSTMSKTVKEELGVENITILADKGYYNANCLEYCQQNGIKAIVSKQKAANSTGNAKYSKDNFAYNKEKNTYICPNGHELSTKSKPESKRKKYSCAQCETCPNRSECTNAKVRNIIVRTEEQAIYDKADELFRNNLELYKKRQQLVEHPFGTIKRSFGYNYFLLRRREKVAAENSLHCLIYNLTRVIKIVGIKNLLHFFRTKKQEKSQPDPEISLLFLYLCTILAIFSIIFPNNPQTPPTH